LLVLIVAGNAAYFAAQWNQVVRDRDLALLAKFPDGLSSSARFYFRRAGHLLTLAPQIPELQRILLLNPNPGRSFSTFHVRPRRKWRSGRARPRIDQASVRYQSTKRPCALKYQDPRVLIVQVPPWIFG